MSVSTGWLRAKSRRLRRAWVATAITGLLVHALPCAAQTPGSLDTSFNSVGYVATAVSSGQQDDRARAVTIQPDGKIVVAGTCAGDVCAVRYLTDGTLDTTFGTAGVALYNLSGSDAANALALQPDGKIILAGSCTNGIDTQFCVSRLLTDGALDTTFGGNSTGWTTFNMASGSETINAIAIQPDGRIVLAGRCRTITITTSDDFCIARLLSSGALDTSFNTTGKLIHQFGGGNFSQVATAVSVQPDGKIVVAGHCSSGTNDVFCAVRILPAGNQLDSAFGGGSGAVFTTIQASMDNRAYAMALQPNGKIVLAGECGSMPCVLRYTTTGSLDVDFASSGTYYAGATTVVSPGNSTGVAVSPTGIIYVASWSNPTPGIANRTVLDLNADGSTRATLFPIVSLLYVTGSSLGYTGAALQRDGKLVVIGSTADGSASSGNFMVARYHLPRDEGRQCSLDIDGDGQVLAMTDGLIQMRVALGLTGNAVTGGITFAAHAQRQNWTSIRNFLVSDCGMLIP